MAIKKIFMSNQLFREWRKSLNNLYKRREFVERALSQIPEGSRILDAGCGSQQFRNLCRHLHYYAQDFGQYTTDEKEGIEAQSIGGESGYLYGPLDYVGDIWDIKEDDGFFDAILCTEVLEHIPYPIETIKEFERLLKPGGQLILTAPSNCLRHMDPYFFYTGFSDRWFNHVLSQSGFIVNSIEVIGDYFSWLKVEMDRLMRSVSIFEYIFILPTLIYLSFKKPTNASINSLCMGYHVIATKRC